MHRVGRWLDRGRSAANASTQSLDSLAESQNLETALRAVELIMDDDITGAEKGLAEGNSAFHKLAKGTLGFMRATLGFEQEVMKEASDTLYEAESSASASYYKAQHDSRAFNSSIYERGSEFALCQAEAQIMSAVVGVLNESLTESIKGFYKLRKAYITLDSLVQMEVNFMKTRGVRSLANSRAESTESLHSLASQKSARSVQDKPKPVSENQVRDPVQPANPSALRNAETVDTVSDDSSGDEDVFHEAKPIRNENPVTQEYTGHLEKSIEAEDMTDLDRKIERMNIQHHSETLQAEGLMRPPPPTSLGMLTEDADSEIFANSLDVFIHSGTNLMSGLLSLLISVIPPAFNKLLYIIGFRGDRERGIRMLWQASKFSNINGGMAGLVLFGWYNGLVGFCDIISDSDPSDPNNVDGYPAPRLQALLVDMRRRYPNSRLWLIEEARMAASKRQVDTALDLLSAPGKSQMKQIEALHMFEKSLNAMYAHRYKLCADSFLACVDLNSWSQGLYFYIAGASHLAAYRHDKSLSEQKRKDHARIAEEYFKTAPTKVGKKKMMGRQLPFDGFVVRKLAKWEARAIRLNCSFVDAIGVNPLEEMIFLWNGYKKMDARHLQESLDNLAWSEDPTKNPHSWEQEELDERSILALLRAVILRNLSRHKESKDILVQNILNHASHEFKGLNHDDWTAPTAHHEMAVNLWMQRSSYAKLNGAKLQGDDPSKETNVEKVAPPPQLDHAGDFKLVQECKVHLEKAKNWEKYELDARLGMKITAAMNAVKQWEEKKAATQLV
ncbi:uncharacterized protein A1O9_11158 [Exophiala aquamarina CBS 119918]|uniref:Inclusion body clearance protein IML2 n=1 Tax=Exophiala aquamarina CBS 119918 TaxID=1182545 RepID=A0A072NYU6_9EURO|nr:uncharacterized protein A1O9_11158 [Exophiala aquamarina CBS 119918]KEF52741.1 hypothetical protein A1O9_11158 [Exophiala aquamarina CBS 119918]